MTFIRPFSAKLQQLCWFLLLTAGAASAAGLYPHQFQLVQFQIRPAGSYLGLRLSDIDNERAKELKLGEPGGVEITAVEDGAAADQAGIRPGDVILTYNGERVLSAQQFIRLVSETPQRRRVRLECWRGGAKRDVNVTTGAPRTFVLPSDSGFASIRVWDVPTPLMLWRNQALGIESVTINEQLAQAFGVKQGILIWSVVPTSRAQRSGLKAGDLLTAFCGHPIRTPRELGSFMQEQAGPKPLSVELIRDHKLISMSIPLDEER